MRKLVNGLVMAIAVGLVFGGAALRAQNLVLNFTVDKLPPGAAVFVAMNIGKIPNATETMKAGASGEALFALNLGSLSKTDPTPVDVYVGECPDKSIRIEIILAGGTPPADCNKKKAGGAFWLNRTTKVTLHYPTTLVTGNFFMTPVGLALIGGGAATGLAIGLGGGDDNGDDDDDDDDDTPGGDNNVFTSYNGTHTGNLNKTSDSCGGFSQIAAISAILNLNTTGQGTWVKTHTAVPATFNFNVQAQTIAAGISFTSTTVGLNGTYNVTDAVSIQSRTATITQTFVRIANPCTVMYQGTANRL
jgi:hypothetical protein